MRCQKEWIIISLRSRCLDYITYSTKHLVPNHTECGNLILHSPISHFTWDCRLLCILFLKGPKIKGFCCEVQRNPGLPQRNQQILFPEVVALAQAMYCFPLEGFNHVKILVYWSLIFFVSDFLWCSIFVDLPYYFNKLDFRIMEQGGIFSYREWIRVIPISGGLISHGNKQKGCLNPSGNWHICWTAGWFGNCLERAGLYPTPLLLGIYFSMWWLSWDKAS